MTPLAVSTVVDGIGRFRVLLDENRAALDELNVYPVPDGDTGTNLLGTVAEIATHLDTADPDTRDLATVAATVGAHAVRAARGNSGIIVAEALRGFVAALAEEATAPEAEALAHALEEAAGLARRAVSHPVEGTVLTVADDAARAARARARSGADALSVATAAADAAWAGVGRTPELLPVLDEAGVVDAGAAGYALWLDALVAALGGDPPRRVPPPPRWGRVVVGGVGGAGASGGPRYEVLVDLVAGAAAVDELRRRWAGMGESVVIVGQGEHWRAHVHTDDPGEVGAAASAVATVERSEVTDLHEQASEHLRSAAAPGPDAGERTGVVAVAASPQLEHLFRALGAGVVVPGGRGARPSGGAIADAVEATAAGHVVVLPNDGPTVEVARQAAASVSRDAVVVPTSSVVEGLVALRAFDPHRPARAAVAVMERAVETVAFAEIAPVVRPSRVGGVEVDVGSWLAIGQRPRFTLAADDPLDAAVLAFDALFDWVDAGTGDDLDLVLVLRGGAGDPKDTVSLRDHVESLYPSTLVEVYETAEPHVAYTLAACRRA